ncbi:MAG: alpha/beta hydrolase [Hyphomonadaceae bacterium]|nr:alpha/beta hydrolase [Hyphomonadaceae bacterium]
MKIRLLSASIAAMLVFASACAPTAPEAPPASEATTPPAAAIPYGANSAASGTFVHDSVTFYYETYGEGDPLLLVHGNGASLGSMAAQIEFFSKRYKVIAMDSREQGKSGGSDAPINYEIMADDLAALLDHLKAGPADIIGWSDGGIEGLLLAMRHPDKVKKLVAMAANLNPSLEAIYPETEAMAKDMVASMPDEAKTTPDGKRFLKVSGLLLSEPHIDPASLGKITAPTLIVSSDHDVIRLEHTVEIFNSLPNANLAVLPNSTHMLPYDEPELFNATVQRFLDTPFVKKDRINDMMASGVELSKEMAH